MTNLFFEGTSSVLRELEKDFEMGGFYFFENISVHFLF
ncbi:hypothetical protein U369_18680 [Bacillus anthracis 52-G]|nr:hypothetical protein U368_18495 [Bacillus anthracis 8903-G]EVT97391.1 hypothetical protein U365_16420 [Bacillus anthracis 9080-G]EVU03442.1 hypothetical protein U369_18680 [Bacillus anthracis 52-G]EXJ19416.1 hypothetical protein Y693_18380 [Bacillus anthracis str. 95014]